MRNFLILILFSMIPLSVLGVDRTFTIDMNLMYALKGTNGLNHDDLIRQYLQTQRDSEPDADSLTNERNERINAMSQNCANIASEALRAVIADNTTAQLNLIYQLEHNVYICPDIMIPQSPNDLGGNQPIPANTPVGSLIHLIYNSLNNYSYINEIPPQTTTGYGALINQDLQRDYRSGTAMYSLTFLSFAYDMLYYAMTPEQQNSIGAKLQVFSEYFYNYLENPQVIGLPANFWDSHYYPIWLVDYYNPAYFDIGGGRVLNIPCAIGYSRIVLGKTMQDPILNWCVSIQRDIPIVGNKVGLLDLLTRTSGTYAGGVYYSSEALTGAVPIFYTALKRTQGINLWNDDRVEEWMSYFPKFLQPNYNSISTEDTWLNWHIGHADRGMLEYFYQNSGDIQGKSNIAWYMNRLKYMNNGMWPITKQSQLYNMDFTVIYSFNPNYEVPITQDINPSFVETGIQSDVEYTQLSNPISDYTGGVNGNSYKNRLWIFVNHENSFEYFQQHLKDEKGQFNLSFSNTQLVPEAGYYALFPSSWQITNPWGITNGWFDSSYSKNMIVVNPDIAQESYYITHRWCSSPSDASLNRKSPISKTNWDNYDAANQIVDPCAKEYVYDNYHTKHLKMNIHIDDVEPDITSVSGEASIERNFYTFGDEFILIHDRVSAINNPVCFRAQLHFNPNPWTVSYNQTNNTFIEHSGTNYLYGTMGALSQGSMTMDGFDANFPIGLPSPNSTTGHKRFRVDTANCMSNSFLTLLIPRNTNTNPIVSTVDTDHSYLVYANSTAGYCTYAGIKSTGSETINNISFTTDAPMFLVEANQQFSDIRKLVLNNGNTCTVHDINSTHFTTVELFHNVSPNVQEFMAEWMNNQLYVTCKSENDVHPKYKILRCGVDPSNFHSRTNFNSYPNDAWPLERYVETNFTNLAYDDLYFYVNYSFNDLVADTSVGQNLVLFDGNYPNIRIGRTIAIGTGDISISGYMNIETLGQVIFMDNSILKINPNTMISVSGLLTGSHAILKCSTEANWSGIRVEEIGTLDLNNCEIKNADVAILCYGNMNLTQCNVHHGIKGIVLSRPDGYVIDACVISNFTDYGLKIIDALTVTQRSIISNTEIRENQIGILCYNSNPFLSKVVIHNNENSGLWTSHNSSPVVKGCSLYENKTITTDYPEIFMDSESYPVFYEGNDIIPEQHGYSIYYQRYPDRIRDMMCIKNFWNLFSELDIRDSIYPDANLWQVDVTPYLEESENGYIPPIPGGKFYLALQKEMENNKTDARALFFASMEEDYGKSESFWSMQHIVQCIEPGTAWDVDGTKLYIQAIADTSSDCYIKSLAMQLTSYCDRMQNNYQNAIDGYEICMNDSQTDIDSLCFLLDIVHTYIEAQQDSSKSMEPIINVAGLNINNLQQAMIEEERLFSLLKNKIEYSSLPIPSVTHLSLEQNYPNPFNPETTINFAILKEGRVTLDVYNIKGQKVKTLSDQIYGKGRFGVMWNGRDFTGRKVASGIYLYRINSNGQSITRKMLMLK